MLFFFASLGVNIESLIDTEVYNHLQIADWFLDALRSFGEFIFTILAGIADVLTETFDQIMKIDFQKIVNLGTLEVTLSDLAWYLLIIVTLLTLLSLPLRKGKDITILRNVLVVLFAVCLFGQFCVYMDGIRTQGVQIANQVFARDNQSISEMIYRDNTFDMLKSIKDKKLTHVSKKIPISGIRTNETMSKNDLQGIVEYDDEGNISVDDLSDGVLNSGLFEERYYRYSTSFFNVNVTLLITCIFLVFASIKIAYILVKLFGIKIFGGVLMSVSITKVDRVKKAFGEVINSTVAFLLVYVGLMMFTKMVSPIMNLSVNWIAKIILIGVVGTAFIFGDIFAEFIGIDTGSAFLMKSMFAGRFMGRALNKAGRPFEKLLSSGMDGAKKGFSKLKNVGEMEKQTVNPQLVDDPLPNSMRLENQDNRIEDQGGGKPLYGFNNGNPPTFDPDRRSKQSVEETKSLYGFENGNAPTFETPNELPADQGEDKNISNVSIINDRDSSDYRIKTYEEYKRDFKNGDESVYVKKYSPTLQKDFETVLGYKLTNRESQTLSDWEQKFGTDMTSHALFQADLYEKKSMGYVHNVLRAWNAKGFKAEDIEEGRHLERSGRYDFYE